MYIVAPLKATPAGQSIASQFEDSQTFALSGPSFETRRLAPLLRMRGTGGTIITRPKFAFDRKPITA
jgi:hypothetical protein